jgi:hypothetical protein
MKRGCTPILSARVNYGGQGVRGVPDLLPARERTRKASGVIQFEGLGAMRTSI